MAQLPGSLGFELLRRFNFSFFFSPFSVIYFISLPLSWLSYPEASGSNSFQGSIFPNYNYKNTQPYYTTKISNKIYVFATQIHHKIKIANKRVSIANDETCSESISCNLKACSVISIKLVIYFISLPQSWLSYPEASGSNSFEGSIFPFFQPLFTAIGKITAHLPGLLFYLIIKFCVNLFLHI